MKRTKMKALVSNLLGSDIKIPINLELIATQLDAKIVHNDLDSASLSGFAFYKDGKKIIGVNSTESEQRQRFTIAHELGHLFLHNTNTINYDKGGIMMFRDGHSSQGLDIKEIEANQFAAELLMPEDKIREDLIEEGSFDLINADGFIKKLATKYNVSEQAMSIRLTTLYFI